MSQMDSCKDHLLVAIGNQSFHFSGDFRNAPAAHTGPDGGYDAVTTVEKAAILNLDKGPLVIVESTYATRMGNDPIV